MNEILDSKVSLDKSYMDTIKEESQKESKQSSS